MFIHHRSPHRASLQEQRLARFSQTQQHYGTYFAGFRWQVFGCVTYRDHIGREGALRTFKSYLDRLRKSLGGVPIAYIAVLQCRTSGPRMSPSHFHWHFVLAGPEHLEEPLRSLQ